MKKKIGEYSGTYVVYFEWEGDPVFEVKVQVLLNTKFMMGSTSLSKNEYREVVDGDTRRSCSKSFVEQRNVGGK